MGWIPPTRYCSNLTAEILACVAAKNLLEKKWFPATKWLIVGGIGTTFCQDKTLQNGTNGSKEELPTVGNVLSSLKGSGGFLFIWMFPKMVGFPPKSSHFNKGFPLFSPFWGTTIFGNTYIPSWELTYPPSKSALFRMIFRTYLLPFGGKLLIVPWRVTQIWRFEVNDVFFKKRENQVPAIFFSRVYVHVFPRGSCRCWSCCQKKGFSFQVWWWVQMLTTPAFGDWTGQDARMNESPNVYI